MRLRAALVGLVISAAAVLGVAPAVAAEGVVAGAGAADAVPGQYVVVLAATPSLRSARVLAERYGGTMTHAYRTALATPSCSSSPQKALPQFPWDWALP